MDIQKEKEAFLNVYVNYKGDSRKIQFNEETEQFMWRKNNVSDTEVEYVHLMNQRWYAWLACAKSKAQAVPEGFVLIKASDRDQEMLELIDQRDHMESQAEELKDKLQALYGVDFGEHSSCNFPFQNAIDYDDSDLVLVPREPNEKMIMNGLLVISTEIGKYDIQQEVRMIWEKMIEAQEPTND